MKEHCAAAKIISGFIIASLIASPINAYAGTTGYVGEESNVFNDDSESGVSFTWSSGDNTLTLTDDVDGDVVADNDIVITTNDNPVTVSGNIEVSTSNPSSYADLTIDNAKITAGGSISADGDVKITDSTVSADGIIGGKDGKGTDGNVIITDSNVTSTSIIAAGDPEQIGSHTQGEYGNHIIVINNSNVAADADDSSIGTQYPMVSVGGTITLDGSYIESPADGSILNQGYYGTDIYMGEVGRVVTSTEDYVYSGAVTIKAGTKPSQTSTPSDINSGSSESEGSESSDTNGIGTASINDNNLSEDSEAGGNGSSSGGGDGSTRSGSAISAMAGGSAMLTQAATINGQAVTVTTVTAKDGSQLRYTTAVNTDGSVTQTSSMGAVTVEAVVRRNANNMADSLTVNVITSATDADGNVQETGRVSANLSSDGTASLSAGAEALAKAIDKVNSGAEGETAATRIAAIMTAIDTAPAGYTAFGTLFNVNGQPGPGVSAPRNVTVHIGVPGASSVIVTVIPTDGSEQYDIEVPADGNISIPNGAFYTVSYR